MRPLLFIECAGCGRHACLCILITVFGSDGLPVHDTSRLLLISSFPSDVLTVLVRRARSSVYPYNSFQRADCGHHLCIGMHMPAD